MITCSNWVKLSHYRDRRVTSALPTITDITGRTSIRLLCAKSSYRPIYVLVVVETFHSGLKFGYQEFLLTFYKRVGTSSHWCRPFFLFGRLRHSIFPVYTMNFKHILGRLVLCFFGRPSFCFLRQIFIILLMSEVHVACLRKK